MSKFWSKFDIFTIDLRVILSIIVATGVYALLLKFLQKNSPHNVQTKGGVNGFLNNVKKNCTFLARRLPLLEIRKTSLTDNLKSREVSASKNDPQEQFVKSCP